jgi:hypothetical protein
MASFVPELFQRHGASAYSQALNRTKKQRWQLRAQKLYMGYSNAASQQSKTAWAE